MTPARPHLIPAFAALIISLMAIAGGHLYALRMENRNVHMMAAQMNARNI